MDSFLIGTSYLSAIVLILISVSNFMLPPFREFIAQHKKTRLTLWAFCALVGCLSVAANIRRDNKSAADRRELTKQVSGLIDQTRILTQGQASALDEAKHARLETENVRDELAKAQEALSAEISNSTGALTRNIDQYRTDTTSAVSRLVRPPRTLGDQRAQFILRLRAAPVPHEVAFSVARGSQEALGFFDEIRTAFVEAGWTIKDTQLVFITKDGIGCSLVMKKAGEENLSESQKAVAIAFKLAGFQLNGAVNEGLKDNGPIEIYVGLQ